MHELQGVATAVQDYESYFPSSWLGANEGNVVQIGTPKELFEKPKTTFVGYFIGSPAMNIYPCDAVSDDEVSIGGLKLKVNTKLQTLKKVI